MNLSVVFLVLLPLSLDVVYSDENTGEISSVLELFPEFKQMNNRISKLETSVSALLTEVKQTNDRNKRLEKGWTLPYKTRLRNFRVTSEKTASTVVSSEMECWIKCAETNGCTSVSFQLAGGKCELSRVTYVSYEVLEKAVGWDVYTKHTPVVSLHDHKYTLNLASAKAHCVSLGLSIATLDDLKAAYNSGYQKCNCGWAANGVAYLVMQEAHNSCLSNVGVLECNWQSTWNVYCKPLKSD
ncbi:hypothetical protein ACJMK2_007711 [Sinanodonta woodiana]|uniref:Link domain-containing protein n=1 Tax=Sinanodonta woodiana TaxID=1069815 RepID=A0ABD3VJP4_SINWO